ncbi:MAG: O-antigen ligase family protein [Cyanobacterium sp.]
MNLNKSTKNIIKPENLPEKLVWYGMIWTYGFYLMGATYVVGSVLGVILGFCVAVQWWLETEETPPEDRISVPLITWVWVIGMLVMEVALIVGHLNYNLGTGMLIKSTIGWAKGWAGFALYPLAGCLKIRPEIIYRAVCIICFHTLLISPLLIIAPILHLPEILYVSPLKAVGGPGTTFFDVSLYEIDFDGSIRQRLFTPWGPALGFVANVYFILALKEKNKKWRWFGIIGAIFMANICKSRLALIAIVLTPLFTFFCSRLTRPIILIFMGISSTIAGILSPLIFMALDTFQQRFTEARADSSRVRRVLKEIAAYRWRTEAPIWGHGVVEPGPHVVEYMPIGSHHTWYGLLFMRGIVGFVALAVPMILSLLVLLIKAQTDEVAKAGLGILFILFLYTFGENLDILAYLYWPGLIIMGIAFKNKKNINSSTHRG